MARFIIEGGRPLNGTVRPSGNKNEALPALAACLLNPGTVTLKRMPKIGDVLTLCDIMRKLGAEVEWSGEETLVVNAAKLHSAAPDGQLCAHIRASILLMGPLLARLGKIELPLPGGDVIGARRIDSHWEGFEAFGVELSLKNGIKGKVAQLKPAHHCLDEPSVTATENLLMLAARVEGVSTLENAASEPHVVGLCKLLGAMGVKIEGIGSNRLVIHGTGDLRDCEHTITADFMEVGSFLCLGAIARGRITIEDADVEQFPHILRVLRRLGINPEIQGNNFLIDGTQPMKVAKEITGRNCTIYSSPWPSFPTDLMSVAIVAATQAQGTVLFFEKMFEGRMFFTDKLMAMGANIVLCDPHRVVVVGPSQLYGARMSSPDVRAGMSLLMASLIALGGSEIDNIYQIERGYQDIDKKLIGLGAAIKKLD